MALATVATVIASQATISGAFSMAQQSALLGLSARIRVEHTSESEFGQIYVPAVNWLLLAGVVGLVMFFKSSTNLAAAYGIAVTGTMLVTTILVFALAVRGWKWPWLFAIPVFAVFLVVDATLLLGQHAEVPRGRLGADRHRRGDLHHHVDLDEGPRPPASPSNRKARCPSSS